MSPCWCVRHQGLFLLSVYLYHCILFILLSLVHSMIQKYGAFIHIYWLSKWTRSTHRLSKGSWGLINWARRPKQLVRTRVELSPWNNMGKFHRVKAIRQNIWGQVMGRPFCCPLPILFFGWVIITSIDWLFNSCRCKGGSTSEDAVTGGEHWLWFGFICYPWLPFGTLDSKMFQWLYFCWKSKWLFSR